MTTPKYTENEFWYL